MGMCEGLVGKQAHTTVNRNALSAAQAYERWRTQEMRLRSLATSRWVFRAWYYFRLGYSTYLTFLLGYVSTLVTVYYLAVQNMPALLDIFPHFVTFAILASAVGAPLAVGLGWIHLKRSNLFSSEVDITTEANPYMYKLPPGATKVSWQITLVQLRILRRLAEANGGLTDPEKAEIDDLERMTLTLLAGGSVGRPRR